MSHAGVQDATLRRDWRRVPTFLHCPSPHLPRPARTILPTIAGEQRALRERMEAAVEVERIDNSSSPFCLFCSKDSCS